MFNSDIATSMYIKYRDHRDHTVTSYPPPRANKYSLRLADRVFRSLPSISPSLLSAVLQPSFPSFFPRLVTLSFDFLFFLALFMLALYSDGNSRSLSSIDHIPVYR